MLKSFIGPFVATFFISMFVLIMQFLHLPISNLYIIKIFKTGTKVRFFVYNTLSLVIKNRIDQAPRFRCRISICLFHNSIVSLTSSSSAKSVIISATSPVKGSTCILNSKYSSSSSASSHRNLTTALLFNSTSVAGCSLPFHIKIN